MPYRKTLEIPMEFIGEEELQQRIRDKTSTIIVDTVWTHGGNRFRIKGATTIPYPEVLDRRRELEQNDEVVVYCTKKTCPGSKIIALGLKLLNVPNVKVYEGGIRGWIERGLPVEEYKDVQMVIGMHDIEESEVVKNSSYIMGSVKTYVFFYKCLDRDEVKKRIEKSDDFILVDLIGTYKGNTYKIHGAVTIPYPELIDRRKELRKYKEVVLYTRNKLCNAARKRAVGLSLVGFENVMVYDAGLDDWMDHNLSVEQ